MTFSITRRAAALVLGALLVPLSVPAASAASPPVAPPGGTLLASTGLVVDAHPGARRLPRVSAATFVLADLETGEVLAARNAHGLMRPASTQKILTFLTLLPELDPAMLYRARFEDANVEGSKVGLVPEATYSVHNLFEGMMLISGNDAANALATAAGGVRRTVARMNAVARELGAINTTVRNPSGLDAPRQYTSAYDLTLITRAAMERADFRRYASTVRSTFPGKMPRRKNKPRRTFQIWTQDKLLMNYRGAIGVKTGFTSKAKGTFVGAATRGGRTLVATVLRTKNSSWEESAALLDWGFANASRVTPVGTLNEPTLTGSTAAPAPVRHQASRAGNVAVPEGGWPGALPWYGWVFAALLAAVVALRSRVLLRKRRRLRADL